MASEVESVPTVLRQALLRDFKAFYNQSRPDLDQLERLYTEDVEFHDPVHTLHGRLALRRYLSGLYRHCRSVAFHYTEENVTDNGAAIAWLMTLSHPRLAGGREIEVRGITMVRFTDRIYYQEDFYDLGSLLYQHVPVLGRIIRYIKGRLAG